MDHTVQHCLTIVDWISAAMQPHLISALPSAFSREEEPASKLNHASHKRLSSSCKAIVTVFVESSLRNGLDCAGPGSKTTSPAEKSLK